MKRQEEEQKCEGSSGLGLNAQYGCKVPPLDHPIRLPVQRREGIPQGSLSE